MQQIKFDDFEALKGLVSEQWGEFSTQFEVTQDVINKFADLTGDKYFLHVDPEAAKSGPFGTTIAHGFLTLSLMTQLKLQETFEITGSNFMVNYGSNKLRFTGAVPVGSRIHSRNRVKSVERLPKGTQLTIESNVHVVGQERPALVYELIVIYM